MIEQQPLFGLEQFKREIPVLDHGFVELIDTMGSDASIECAARVSYNGDGEVRKYRETRALLRYMMKHGHTSPYEMAEIVLHVKLPIFVERQWIRHRTACLAGDMPVSFDLPGRLNDGRGHYSLTVKQLFDRWQPTENTQRPDKQLNPLFKRERVMGMCLRVVDENTGDVLSSSVEDVRCTGVKTVWAVKFENGSFLRATADHRCLTNFGWMQLKTALETKNVLFASIGRRIQERPTPAPLSVDELNKECWKTIPGIPSNYEVSNLGRVRNWNNVRNVRQSAPKIKTATISRGYPTVSLSWDGVSKAFQVHRLVLRAFVREAQEFEQCRHLDGCSSNNRLSNLRWGSVQENADDRMAGDGDQSLRRVWVKASSWGTDGEEEVYDISVRGPWHNFVAGGIVVHNSVNELSARYSELPEEYYVPELSQVCYQSTDNKQGRSGPLDIEEAGQFQDSCRFNARDAFDEYHNHLKLGIAKETARINLPLSTYTRKYWKMDANNLMHFMKLRLDPHAQWEIRQYAEVIFRIFKAWLPITAEAFIDYKRDAATFSRMEVSALKRVAATFTDSQAALMLESLIEDGCSLREIKQFTDTLGIRSLK